MQNKQLAREYAPVDEQKFTRDLAGRLKAKIVEDHRSGIMRRDAHPKMHGVVKAEFIIEPDLPQALRVGVFRQPGVYPAWIRFSNADAGLGPDIRRGIRGMAIKLMDVAGEKILHDEKNERTQDFLLISTNVFLTRDVREFDNLTRALTGSILAKIVFFLRHWRVVRNVFKSMKRFANPLQIRYWSTTPYLFGNAAVKYSAIPHVDAADAIPGNPDKDFLRKAMAAQLAHGTAVFDFAVQFQADADRMPIEDSGCEWSETVSPFRKIATIKILQQHCDDEKHRQFGENLSYTPWHSLPEHRPLGGINRARRVVYRTISMFRHAQNNVPMQEPAGFDIEKSGAECR
ncbi:MAG: hypothetical protein JWQ21_3447 [Herminiimonas sp.]|nr:hypothetical protein [Herminiimonas sp.]